MAKINTVVFTIRMVSCLPKKNRVEATRMRPSPYQNHPRGAKYFNGREPLEVVYSENGHTRSSACQREAAIKKLSRDGKLRLIAACRN